MPGGLGRLHRPSGCIPPCAHPPLFSEVPQVRLRQSCLSVPSAAVRAFDGTSRVHDSHGDSSGGGQTGGGRSSPVSGRLAHSPSLCSDPPTESVGGLGISASTRTHSQSREVGAGSHAGFFLRGNELLDRSSHHQGSVGSGSEHLDQSVSGPEQGVPVSQGVPVAPGGSGGSGRVCSSGTAPSAASPVLPARAVEAASRSSGSFSPTDHHCQEASQVVGSGIQVLERDSDGATIPDSVYVHRRVKHRLGGPFGASQPVLLGPMVSTGIAGTHQPAGSSGGFPGSDVGGVLCTGAGGVGFIRQHYSGSFHQQTGRDSFDPSVSTDARVAPVVSRQTHLLTCPPYSGPQECSGRLPVPAVVSGPDGMVVASVGVQCGPVQMGGSVRGSFCDKSESSLGIVRLPCARSSGMGGRRNVLVVGSSGRVRISTVCDAASGPAENSAGSSSNHVGGSVLAHQELVCHPPGAADRAAHCSAGQAGSPVSACRSNPAPERSDAQPSRLAVIRQAVRREGFSESAAKVIAGSQRPSTTKLYDAKWRAWADWCDQRQVDSLDPPLGDIGEFFLFLFNTKNLSVSAIRGYRAAFSSALKFSLGAAKSVGLRSQIVGYDRAFCENSVCST